MVKFCTVDNFFTEVFKSFTSEFSWTSLFILLTGIFIGFIIALCIYLVVFLSIASFSKLNSLIHDVFVFLKLLKNPGNGTQ